MTAVHRATGRRRAGRSLAWLILHRLLAAVLVLWVAVTLTFIAVQLTPGDTVSLLLGENRNDPELRAQTIARWGLDQPVWVQYLTYLTRIPSGDLGISYTLRRPVADLIAAGIGPTLQLTAVAAVAAIVLAVVGAVATTAAIPGLRRVAGTVELVLLSAPPFWLAIVLLWGVSFQLGWFSIVEQGSWQALVLPAASLALPIGAYLTQVLVEGIDRAMEQPFITTARSRGISQFAARARHALRHAAMPAIHLLGLIVGSLLGGAVIVEQVFGRPGLGQLAVDAVTVKDIPLILGVALVSTAAFVVASTAADIVALSVDPRTRVAAGVSR
ncbi:ABC transporter permease [Tessaracoccus palaemonis]|uniref:ABC transporter permease n=1 Tax=Tessaracoccus palaemonis TaxID=2829499 RepID=A0ABX8SF74_9ACTN|nr:ABC transporter permease [Tessaracoccus palaemonis]QXT61925.1 ABC transporter permease [Tessaracoccus palaemonis]